MLGDLNSFISFSIVSCENIITLPYSIWLNIAISLTAKNLAATRILYNARYCSFNRIHHVSTNYTIHCTLHVCVSYFFMGASFDIFQRGQLFVYRADIVWKLSHIIGYGILSTILDTHFPRRSIEFRIQVSQTRAALSTRRLERDQCYQISQVCSDQLCSQS